MVRGQADFGQYSPKALGASLSDMADLAVRLGSVVEYDRRGDVIYLDDYEAPVKKYEEVEVGGCYTQLDSTAVVSGAQSCKLVTLGVEDDYIETTYYLMPFTTGRHGIKIAVSLYEMEDYDSYYQLSATIRDGSYVYAAYVNLNPYAKTIQYLNGSNTPVTFEENFLAASYEPQMFHNIKLVIDLDEAKYVRLLLDAQSWDMSALSLYKVESPSASRALIGLGLLDRGGHAFTVWQDNFVYTINEP